MSWYTNPKVWSFVGGAAAAVLGGVVCKAECTRKAAVRVVAKGIQVKESCSESLQSFKDDAEDLAEEARQQAKLEAERQDRRAAIEARIREQVEAELAAQDEAAAGQAEDGQADE